MPSCALFPNAQSCETLVLYFRMLATIAKTIAKNQLTLPKSLTQPLGGPSSLMSRPKDPSLSGMTDRKSKHLRPSIAPWKSPQPM